MKNHSFKNSLRKFVANDLISAMCYWKLHFNEHIIFKSKLIIYHTKKESISIIIKLNTNQRLWFFGNQIHVCILVAASVAIFFQSWNYFISKWMLRKNAKTQTVIKCERASFFFSGHRTILAVDLRKHFIRKTWLECLSNTAR